MCAMTKANTIQDSHEADDARAAVAGARRIVVKIGSRVLVQKTGGPNARRIRSIVKDISLLARGGREIVFVTSGAIGAGMKALAMKRRPDNLPDLQMAAAVGQSRLMTRYDKLFSDERRKIGQVLLTHDDLKHRARHLNARNTILNMLRNGVIPVVNENDAVAVDEIKFGDNDLLASLVAHLIDADLLVMLTTSDGLRRRTASGRSIRVARVARVTAEIIGLASGKGGELSTGGMASKLEAARAVTDAGAAVVIADGRKPGILGRILAGEDTGTLLAPAPGHSLQSRKRWIAFFHKAGGALVVDDGACRAILKLGKSLLPVGIKDVEGCFGPGAAVDIAAPDHTVIARGLTYYSSDDLCRIKGRRTGEISAILGTDGYDEAVHRDNMVVLGS